MKIMLRISKLTDYALVILSSMKEGEITSASNISKLTHIPLATTNKVLKQLAKSNICSTRSGKMGGFLLSHEKNKISLLMVIRAMEPDNITLTQCGNKNTTCMLSPHCKITEKMNVIDKEINHILSNRFLSDLS